MLSPRSAGRPAFLWHLSSRNGGWGLGDGLSGKGKPQRRRYDDTEDLLVRGPDDRTNARAVAVYGKKTPIRLPISGSSGIYLPLLAQIDGDAFRVTTTSSVLWVDAPKVDGLRKLRDQQGEDQAARP